MLVANIALISFLSLKKDRGNHEKRTDRKTVIAEFLKNEIGFDAAQLQLNDTLSGRHKEHMKKMMDSLSTPKDKQFKELVAANFNDSVMNTIANQSAATQKVMELQMFNHLKNVRSLCTPAQLPKFDSLFGKVFSRKGGDYKKKDTQKI